jgi:hypothetical protein
LNVEGEPVEKRPRQAAQQKPGISNIEDEEWIAPKG